MAVLGGEEGGGGAGGGTGGTGGAGGLGGKVGGHGGDWQGPQLAHAAKLHFICHSLGCGGHHA